MKEIKRRQERGAVEVEATFILPIAILSTLLLLYLSLFLCQRANLQAVLETAVVYYKNTLTDTYVIRNDEVIYENSDGNTMGSSNSYEAEVPLNPYTSRVNKKIFEDFETYFDSIAGNMLFNDNLKLTIDYHNLLLVKQIDVTATQIVEAPIDFSILGVDNQYEIVATARVVVSDHDATIRNVDYIIDLVEDTKLGDMAGQLASKISEFYNTFKSKLGV